MVRKSDKNYWGSNFPDRKNSFDDSAEFRKLKNLIKDEYKESEGYDLRRHPYGKTGPDAILFKKNGKPYIHFAFERRGFKSWRTGRFRFKTLHIPAEKDYLMEMAKKDDAHFISWHFCFDLTRAYYATPKVIKESPIVPIKCETYDGYSWQDHRDLPVNKLVCVEFP
tara:strand:+ start:105 stop:605 length:501 start_codon:yes stop_codon:yes gene_type:complete